MVMRKEVVATFVAHDEVPEDDPDLVAEVIRREPWEQVLARMEAPGTPVEFSMPRNMDRRKKEIVHAFHDAFQLIGGTPRLALWANENPTEFYRIYSKLLPKQIEQETKTDGQVRVMHVLPRGPLDE